VYCISLQSGLLNRTAINIEFVTFSNKIATLTWMFVYFSDLFALDFFSLPTLMGYVYVPYHMKLDSFSKQLFLCLPLFPLFHASFHSLSYTYTVTQLQESSLLPLALSRQVFFTPKTHLQLNLPIRICS
jgi:hypothetical protein